MYLGRGVKTVYDRIDALISERDELKAEVARLRDDVEDVITLLSDTEHTDDYVARTAGKHLLDMVLNPEELPFDTPTISDHAPDVTQACEHCGADMERTAGVVNGYRHYVCAKHGVRSVWEGTHEHEFGGADPLAVTKVKG